MSTRRLAAAAAVALASLVATGTGASADTTLDRKLAPAPGTGYVPLQAVRGERYLVRRGGSAKARKGRAGDRRSLLMFAQLTDPQIADEMSPARVDSRRSGGRRDPLVVAPAGGDGASQVFDATVRAVNANRLESRSEDHGVDAAGPAVREQLPALLRTAQPGVARVDGRRVTFSGNHRPGADHRPARHQAAQRAASRQLICLAPRTGRGSVPSRRTAAPPRRRR